MRAVGYTVSQMARELGGQVIWFINYIYLYCWDGYYWSNCHIGNGLVSPPYPFDEKVNESKWSRHL